MLTFIRMPPRWKIRREVLRIAVQFQDLIDELHEPFFKFWHDWNRASTIKVSEGGIPLKSERVAVLLIYQPSGIPESLFKTCEYLAMSGYSPLVVCNSTLASADLKRLLEISWKIMARPNFGYDFGGYRDAVWLLNKLNVCPQFLLFLNDSIWFPISSDATILEEMESSQAEYVGTFEYEIIKRRRRTVRKRLFYPSYLFMVKRGVFRSKEFQNFWKTYRVSSRKHKVIRRGEIGLSNMLISSRFTSASIVPREGFSDALYRMDSQNLKDELTYLVSVDQQISKVKLRLMETYGESHNWADECREFLMVNCQNNAYFHWLPVFTIQKLGISYFKKLRHPIFINGQYMILAAARSGKFENAIFDYVLEEIEANISSANP